MASLLPIILLKKVLFPTLGRPTIATIGLLIKKSSDKLSGVEHLEIFYAFSRSYELDRHVIFICYGDGYSALRDHLNDGELGLFLETAHPAKFIDTVEKYTGKRVEIPARLQKFAEGTKLPESGTAVSETAANAVNIYAYQNVIVVENATEEISVYNAMGALVCRDVALHLSE